SRNNPAVRFGVFCDFWLTIGMWDSDREFQIPNSKFQIPQVPDQHLAVGTELEHLMPLRRSRWRRRSPLTSSAATSRLLTAAPCAATRAWFTGAATAVGSTR